MYLNKVFLIGNLTRDPELKALPSGTKVANFSIATNRKSRNKDGVLQDFTEYHNIVAFSKLGELTAQYLKKGQQALVEGRIQTRSWEQNGEKKYRTEIIAENVQFGWKGTGGASGGAAGPGKEESETKENAAGETIEYPTEEINPDDIPF
ncbi:MAG: single-stranded DNA-binding protein [Patescibacteria group bacterium]|nr:single-stranded DNA-binding protein [Patescibacteria group bacterium]MDE2172526.1 single-stranded DNA-binding protein [Patescibacteria group bacterium]